MTRLLPTVATLSAAILAGSLFTAPAMADGYVTESVTLSYDTAELESEITAETVLRDLERQARQACTSVAPFLSARSVDKVCVTNVLEQAVEGINSPALSAVFEQNDAYKVSALQTSTASDS